MAVYGYGNVPDRGFVAFHRELDDAAWKDITPKKADEQASENAALLLDAPQPVIWKLRLRWGSAGVIAALGATSLVELDGNWDSAQRRLFHRVALGIDDADRAVRDAADRLSAQILAGMGTGQTQYDYDAEVDFGLNQIALTQGNGPLAADAKKLKLADALADVAATTEALARGLGRGTGDKRRPPSRKLRTAIAECAASFNGVHEDIAWFIGRTPPGGGAGCAHCLAGPARSAAVTPCARGDRRGGARGAYPAHTGQAGGRQVDAGRLAVTFPASPHQDGSFAARRGEVGPGDGPASIPRLRGSAK